jgi:dihydrofolate synthase/folylpolyglutamate synthase
MRKTLIEWLDHIRTLHTLTIDYTLNRIATIAQKLELLSPGIPVITITGTNGKGSVVSTMEAILTASGYQVGSYTSPYLENYCEQIRLNQQWISETQLIDALTQIEEARDEISLSEFEFMTLAALLIFKHAKLDIILLEVGLGGGNDAVNIIAASILVITSIAFDHEEYLGHTLHEIAESEAGLLRQNIPVIIGVEHPPLTLHEKAQNMNCQILRYQKDFYDDVSLPKTQLLPRNVSIAITALGVCPMLAITQADIITGLQQINLKGRQQLVLGKPSWLVDVAHNPEAITALVERLKLLELKPQKIIAVFSMFKDKKITDTIQSLAPFIAYWSIAPIEHARGASLDQLQQSFDAAGISKEKILTNETLSEACQQAAQLAGADDLILAFGSFYAARAGLCFLNESNPLKNPHNA